MTILEYFKDKGLFILVNALLYICAIFFARILEVNINLMFLVGIIWFLPLLAYMIVEYCRMRKFFYEIKEVTRDIELKFLATEIIKKPNFIEGEILYDVLRESNRNMHEKVSYYEKKQCNYREYMDMWVHEIKTPIAATRLIIENENSKIKNTLDRELSKVDKMIEQVLYYSKIDKANEDYKIKRVVLKEIIMKTIKNNSMEFIMKKIKINIENLDMEIFTDRKWLEFIINQIINNSLKYTKTNGEITIVGKEIKNAVELSIIDTGVGINNEDLDKVFQKGYTGENGRIFGKSTGMGLYICKKLCNKLNIGISIESIEGTRVNLTIPKGENTNLF